jgi:pimeloyl-ACP methyl ester carboxylesterase
MTFPPAIASSASPNRSRFDKEVKSMATLFLQREGGRLAYSDFGAGPLVVCVPGLGDLREEYRFLTPRLVESGFRVISMDLRGHGESSTGWPDYSAEAIGDDIAALLDHLNAVDAVVIGTSMAAGSAAWAAPKAPDRISAVVLIGPFARDVGPDWQRALLRGVFRIVLARPWGTSFWMRFWAGLFATTRPADFATYASALRNNLDEPGRLEALRAMMLGKSRWRIEARLSEVRVPALVVMGSKDHDFSDPEAEAKLIARRLNGEVAMIEGAGHYPHVEYPQRTGDKIIGFARKALRREDVATHATEPAGIGSRR